MVTSGHICYMTAQWAMIHFPHIFCYKYSIGIKIMLCENMTEKDDCKWTKVFKAFEGFIK